MKNPLPTRILGASRWLMFGISALITMASAQAQISQVGNATTATVGGSTSSSHSITLNKPDGVQTGDVLIAAVTKNGNANATTPPSGWTGIHSTALRNTSTAKQHTQVYYKVVDGSEGPSFSFTIGNVGTGGSNGASGAIVAFTGVDATGGVDKFGSPGGPFAGQPGTFGSSTQSTTSTANSINVASNGAALIMVCGSGGQSSTWSNWTSSNHGALTELSNVVRQGCASSMAWKASVPSGDTGSATANIPSTSYHASLQIALKADSPPFDASPTVVDAGGSTQLTWDATGADSVSIDNGVGAVASSGSTIVSPASTTTYTLTADFGGTTKTSIVTVTVMEPGPYRYYRFVPVTLRGGQNMVQLDEFQMVLNGERVPAVTTSNPGGSNSPDSGEGSDKANDNIPAYTGVTGVDLGSNTKWLDGNKKPLVYDFGTTQDVTAYRWATGNDSDDRDPVSWRVEGSHDGVNWKALDTQTNYSVPTTRNAYLEDFALQPFAGPAVSSFAAADSVILIGSSTTLSWVVSGAESITLDGSPVAAIGSQSVSPLVTTTYTLTAIGEGITRNRTVEVVVVNSGLIGETFDTLGSSSFLDPISGLLDATPSGTFIETGPISYPDGSMLSLPGITNGSDFCVLWIGWFDVSIGGAGEYTFGVGSDDASVIYLDLNNDGDFADAGEKIVSTGGGGGPTNGETATIDLQMDAVRIAIGFQEGAGNDLMYAKYKKGSGLAYTALNPISGANEAFLPNEPVSGKPVINSFTATPADIEPGDSATLSWSVSDADSVTLDDVSVDATGSTTVTPSTTTTYVLVATNAVGLRAKSATVSVGYFPVNYDFDDNTFQGWTEVYLSPVTKPWLTTGGHGDTHNGSAHAIRSEYHDDAHPTMILRSPEFKLNGSGEMYAHIAGGSHTSSLVGTAVSALPVNATEPGFQGIALRNVTTGTYVLSAQKSSDGNEYQKLTFSSGQLSGLDQSAVYTLDFIDAARGGWGWTAMDTVQIPGTLYSLPLPPVVSFTASPTNVSAGGSSTLSWEVTGATSITLDGSPVGASGTQSVTVNATTSYTLSATNDVGTTTVVANVVVPNGSSYTFDFNNRTFQGWSDLTVPNTNNGPRGWTASENAPEGTSLQGGIYEGDGGVRQYRTGLEDNPHPTLVLRSPEFTLNGSGDLTAYLEGGPGAGSLAGTAVSALPANSTEPGFQGIALRNATTGNYVLSTRKVGEGGWELVSLSAAQLAALDQAATYTLDFIDQGHGGWGWVVMDSVTIPGNFTTLAVPTITTTGTLSALSATYGTASSAGSFTVSGADLTAAITITAPAGVEVSASEGSGYAGSIEVGAAGTLAETTVYARLTAAAAGSVSGDISLTSSGATSKTVAVSGTVSAKELIITADAKGKTYGDADPALTYSSSGLIGSDAISGSLSRASGENVGSYAIGQGTLSAGSNYSISYTGADLTIGAKAITVTADAQSKTFGDADPALTYTADGLVGGDSLAGALSREPGENVGSYAIGQGTLDGGSNYSITSFNGADLTISAKGLAGADITLTRNEDDSYTASADGVAGFTYSYEGRDGTSYGPDAAAPDAPGSYTVTATVDDPNFTGSKSEDYVIYETGDLTFSGLQPAYDGSGKSPVVSLNGTVNNDVTVGYRAIDRTAAPAVYSNLPASLEQSYESHAFQAQQTSAFGNLVELGGTNRVGDHVEVVMVTWASAAMFPAQAAEDPTGWRHPLTVSIAGLVDDGEGGSMIEFTEESTVHIHIPWRPATVSEGGDYPYNGYAFKAVIPLSGKVALPEQCVVLIGFNTGTYGFEPLGYEGPFDYLNIAIDPSPETIGSDLDPDALLVERDTNPPTGAVLGYESGWGEFGSPLITIAARESVLTDPVFSSTAQVNAGDYHVYVTHPGGDEAYATLTILPAALAAGDITLADNGDGSYSASADGVSGFAIVYEGRNGTSYGPSSTPPTEPGDYSVTATSADPNYSGSKSADYSIAGPPPSDHPAYKITSISMVGSVCTMTWESQPDAVYTVQATANLADGSSWQPIHSGIASGGSSTTVSVDLSTTSHSGATKLFMRVVTGTPD